MYVLPVPEALEILRGRQRQRPAGDLPDRRHRRAPARGEKVAASKVADPTLVLGVNSPEELAERRGS